MPFGNQYATIEESADDVPEEIVVDDPDEPHAMDMVIKNDFAKYMMDQRASLVPTNSPIDKSTCISSPAHTTTITSLATSLVTRVLVKANVPSIPSVIKSTTKPFIKFEVEVKPPNQEKLYFTVLFEESLLKFLPQDPACYESVYASFASTSMDKFLFIQFATINLQIRTLLLAKDQDLKRIFTEKSFFAVVRSTSALWKKNFNFEISQVWDAQILKPFISSNCVITVRDPVRNHFYEKDDYNQISLQLRDPSRVSSFYLYSHAANVGNILSVFNASKHTSVVCTKTGNNYDFEAPGGEKVRIKEVESIKDVPRNILQCSNFIIKQEIQHLFSSSEFLKTTQRIFVSEMKVPKEGILCPFPSCSFSYVHELNENWKQTEHFKFLLEHLFDNHIDFFTVILGQLTRHQEKKHRTSTSCPIENCSFSFVDISLMVKHYGTFHKIGQIVFLQFALENRWSIERFKQIGFLSDTVMALAQCSHCYEVMTRQQLAIHVAQIR